MKFLMMGESNSQSLWSHLRCGGAGSRDGDASSIVMGTWFEPVEGREVSHAFTNGRSRGLVKARTITEGCAFPERWNLVYTPGECRRAKPPSGVKLKNGAEEGTCWDAKERTGSDRGLWMFRSSTTKSGMPVSGKRDSRRMEWTLRSAELIE